ncbi:MAG: alpha/beta hydrolase [Simkaniaceae bacterium]|nr:alpha/beta hydrolase [Simkaniaceae bacterium]
MSTEALVPTMALTERGVINTASLVVRVPLMIASEGLTLILGLISTALCGRSEASPDLRKRGVAILMIHGSGFNQSEWLPLKGYLAADQRVGPIYTVNYAGLLSGEKGARIRDYALHKIMPKIREIFSETGREQLILIGHSLGGLIAAETAEWLLRRDQVVKVVTICTPFKGVPLLNYCCVSKATDEEMQEGSTYLSALSLQIQSREARGEEIPYHHIVSRTDFLVPAERGGIAKDPSKWRVLDGIEGHWGVVLSPRVWMEIKRAILK